MVPLPTGCESIARQCVYIFLTSVVVAKEAESTSGAALSDTRPKADRTDSCLSGKVFLPSLHSASQPYAVVDSLSVLSR